MQALGRSSFAVHKLSRDDCRAGSVWKDWVKSVVIGSHGDLGDPAFHPQEAVMGFPVIIES